LTALRYQQNLRAVGVAILIMVAPSNRLEDLLPLLPAIMTALDSAQPGQVIEIAR
jgi:hypothetical protein